MSACELWSGRIDPERGAIACGKPAVVHVVDDGGSAGAWICAEHARALYKSSDTDDDREKGK